jgi:hypothetical protein
VAVTDPQVDGLPPAAERTLDALFLADADELAYFGETLGREAASYQPGVDPRGKLLAFADTLALPVLRVQEVEQRGGTLEPAGPRPRPLAEGGTLRLFFTSRSLAPLELRLTIDGHELRREVPLDALSSEGAGGRSVRRGLYAALLGDWMAEYEKSEDPELRARIVATSVREGIPTALTGLQVDDGASGAMAPTATAGPLLRLLGAATLALGLALLAAERRRRASPRGVP